jgi:hypothetical protein
MELEFLEFLKKLQPTALAQCTSEKKNCMTFTSGIRNNIYSKIKLYACKSSGIKKWIASSTVLGFVSMDHVTQQT